MKPLSISELTLIIKEVLEGAIGDVCVEGEISNLRKQSSGHLYFTLKDASAQLSVVMFRHDAAYLKFAPQDGQLVVANGEITVYPPRGSYQLRATSLKPKGKGNLQEKFEALKRKLALEGLFAEERKKSIPIFPRKVGIITSPTGAALRDFLQILQRRCPRIRVQIFGVKVQGENSLEEIIFALQELNRRKEVDVIVLARGGGSLEDLWSFNEETVVRAVAASKIPTISGVGHEIDFTLTDFAADLRAPTPSAAAELLSRADQEWRDDLLNYKNKLTRDALSQLETLRQKYFRLSESYVFREPQKIVQQWVQRVGDLQQGLVTHTQHILELRREKLKNIFQTWDAIHPRNRIEKLRQTLSEKSNQLRLLSPQKTLERGYSIVFDQQKNIIKKRENAIFANDVTVRFSDGDVPMRVKK